MYVALKGMTVLETYNLFTTILKRSLIQAVIYCTINSTHYNTHMYFDYCVFSIIHLAQGPGKEKRQIALSIPLKAIFLHRKYNVAKCLLFFLENQCFSLLGVNGAGKTTIFKMLTGDIGPSRGRLLIQDQTGYGALDF